MTSKLVGHLTLSPFIFALALLYPWVWVGSSFAVSHRSVTLNTVFSSRSLFSLLLLTSWLITLALGLIFIN